MPLYSVLPASAGIRILSRQIYGERTDVLDQRTTERNCEINKVTSLTDETPSSDFRILNRMVMALGGRFDLRLYDTLPLARDLYPERLPGDEPEELEVVPWKFDRLHELILRDDFSEGRSIAALFIAREWLRHPQ